MQTDDEEVTLAGERVEVADTVGAGDAFVAALTWQLLEDATLVEAARVACAAGAVTVTRPGARSSPTRAELEP